MRRRGIRGWNKRFILPSSYDCADRQEHVRSIPVDGAPFQEFFNPEAALVRSAAFTL